MQEVHLHKHHLVDGLAFSASVEVFEVVEWATVVPLVHHQIVTHSHARTGALVFVSNP
jgi:hypothetical protein